MLFLFCLGENQSSLNANNDDLDNGDLKNSNKEKIIIKRKNEINTNVIMVFVGILGFFFLLHFKSENEKRKLKKEEELKKLHQFSVETRVQLSQKYINILNQLEKEEKVALDEYKKAVDLLEIGTKDIGKLLEIKDNFIKQKIEIQKKFMEEYRKNKDFHQRSEIMGAFMEKKKDMLYKETHIFKEYMQKFNDNNYINFMETLMNNKNNYDNLKKIEEQDLDLLQEIKNLKKQFQEAGTADQVKTAGIITKNIDLWNKINEQICKKNNLEREFYIKSGDLKILENLQKVLQDILKNDISPNTKMIEEINMPVFENNKLNEFMQNQIENLKKNTPEEVEIVRKNIDLLLELHYSEENKEKLKKLEEEKFANSEKELKNFKELASDVIKVAIESENIRLKIDEEKAKQKKLEISIKDLQEEISELRKKLKNLTDEKNNLEQKKEKIAEKSIEEQKKYNEELKKLNDLISKINLDISLKENRLQKKINDSENNKIIITEKEKIILQMVSIKKEMALKCSEDKIDLILAMNENGKNPDETFCALNEKLFAIKRYENAIEDYNRIWAKEEKDKLNLSNEKKDEIKNVRKKIQDKVKDLNVQESSETLNDFYEDLIKKGTKNCITFSKIFIKDKDGQYQTPEALPKNLSIKEINELMEDMKKIYEKDKDPKKKNIIHLCNVLYGEYAGQFKDLWHSIGNVAFAEEDIKSCTLQNLEKALQEKANKMITSIYTFHLENFLKEVQRIFFLEINQSFGINGTIDYIGLIPNQLKEYNIENGSFNLIKNNQRCLPIYSRNAAGGSFYNFYNFNNNNNNNNNNNINWNEKLKNVTLTSSDNLFIEFEKKIRQKANEMAKEGKKENEWLELCRAKLPEVIQNFFKHQEFLFNASEEYFLKIDIDASEMATIAIDILNNFLNNQKDNQNIEKRIIEKFGNKIINFYKSSNPMAFGKKDLNLEHRIYMDDKNAYLAPFNKKECLSIELLEHTTNNKKNKKEEYFLFLSFDKNYFFCDKTLPEIQKFSIDGKDLQEFKKPNLKKVY